MSSRLRTEGVDAAHEFIAWPAEASRAAAKRSALPLDFPGWAAEGGDQRREALSRCARDAVLVACGTPLVNRKLHSADVSRDSRRAGYPLPSPGHCGSLSHGWPAVAQRDAGLRYSRAERLTGAGQRWECQPAAQHLGGEASGGAKWIASRADTPSTTKWTVVSYIVCGDGGRPLPRSRHRSDSPAERPRSGHRRPCGCRRRRA